MRLALVSLLAIAGFAPVAQAQTPAPEAAPPAAPAEATPAAPEAPAAAPEAPPAPPAPPTDPAAIGLLSAVEKVCVPAANGGNLAQLAKAAGYRKSGENFVYKQPTYQFTILAPGSNPTQCHIDVVHPIYPDAPAKPLVIALHNWLAIGQGWNLYRNDKNVEAGQEFTTRSWEHHGDGKSEALVITTIRKADGAPSQKNADTSMVIYNVSKTPA
jgi:hypothetical protein